MVVGVDTASEESTAIRFCGVSTLGNSGRAAEAIQLLGGASRTVGSVGVLTVSGLVVVDEVVLASGELLHATSALDVLVTGVRDWVLAVQTLTSTTTLWFLKLGSSTLDTIDLEGQSTLLTDGLVDQTVLAQELSRQISFLVAQVKPITLYRVRNEVPFLCWSTNLGRFGKHHAKNGSEANQG